VELSPSELSITVVVPALNEAERIGVCLSSLCEQTPPVHVMVSDNASTDGTAELARTYSSQLDLTVRTITRLGPSSHFIDAGRWALASSDSNIFALLAGDDSWTAGFVAAAMALLAHNQSIEIVFPSFVWDAGSTERMLAPADFSHPDARRRQLKALLWPDRRELSNLVYGVYRREAFKELLLAWQRGGDEFGSDYAAAWTVLGAHRCLAAEKAVSRRHTRGGADLLGRVGMAGAADGSLVQAAKAYVRLSLRINRLLGIALRRANTSGWAPSGWQIQVLRAPQWLWAALSHARAKQSKER
jgi:glycosyltransferase involved in cell wall biosynthesis